MLDKIVHNEAENDSPYLPWLEEARRQIHEDRKGLTPEERALYWANVRAELAREAELRPKESRVSSYPLPILQPAAAIPI